MSAATLEGDAALHPVDRRPPAATTVLFAIQHVLVFYGSGVLLPIVAGRALGLSPEDIIYLISADLFTCGIATLLQSVGVWKFGAKLPTVQGLATFAIPVVISTGKGYGLPVVYGAVIVTGLLSMIAAPYAVKLLRLFPRIVIGVILIAIGINLINISLKQMGGFSPVDPNFGDPATLALSFGTLIVVVLLYRTGTGLLRSASLLIAMVAMTAAAALLGKVSFAKAAAAAPLAVVMPFHFGLPQFALGPTLLMLVIGIVAMVETVSSFASVEGIIKKPVDEDTVERGLLASGLATLIGGVFNSFPYAVYLGNVGVLEITGVISRWVVAAAGVLMVVLSLFPKVSALFEAVPDPIIGGAGLMMFGLITLQGIRMVGAAPFERTGNAILVALSLGIGLAPVLTPTLLAKLPPQLGFLTGNTILLTAVVAVLLNLFLNSAGAGSPREAQSAVRP
ncbi:MAG TPA: nucleobase:cation symporter-2 family protein [Alphaproteobacteria bacterium]|nr:nucleobase:cation symporter-2 family protein [Alphaproteobacteria bacterium]